MNIDCKNKEYLSEKEAHELKQLFVKYLKFYKEKGEDVTDREWLEELFKREIQEGSEEDERNDARNIIESIEVFDHNLESVNSAAKKGISKENWIADKMQEASIGMSVNEYGQSLQSLDDFLYRKNLELADALHQVADGHIKMSPNLDGNIAENMIAKTTELSSFIQGKNIKVEVRDVFTKNSVDLRAINLDTGKYQNYQLKFGKNAKATIELIERGNYNNQQIVVPKEQMKEIQTYFKAKGSDKTIIDHIDAWGVKGKRFTKEEMKELQIMAQEDGIIPSMDYNHYQTKDLAISIGKNAGVMALQTAAVTTGINIASKVFSGEQIDADDMVEIAIKTGADTGIKVVTAGTLQVAIRKGIISFIPRMTPAGVIANIACVGIENVRILGKIASGELSMTKGLDQMGRVTTSMVAGLWAMAKGAAIGIKLTAWIPVLGAPLAVISGFAGGMVGYFGGSKLGDTIYSTGKKVASTAKNIAKSVVNGLKKASNTVVYGVKKVFNKIFG